MTNGRSAHRTTIDAPNEPLPVYVAKPQGEGPWPAVLVVHDALGMTADLRNQADWLAEHGYLAVAPDLYRGKPVRSCLFSTFRDLFRRSGPTFADFEAVRRWALNRPDTTDRIGVIGFCMGGGFVLALAPRGYDVASVNYGMLPRNAHESLRGACPVVGSYGARDPSLRGAASKLARTLDDLQVPNDVVEYPTAGHGFLNDHKDPPSLVVVLGKALRQNYVPEAADDARARIADFFREHLSGTAAGQTR